MSSWKVQLFELNYDDQETKVASSVVRDGWLTMGRETEEFETEFTETLALDGECIAVSSCTAALHMALVAGGVSVNDEVIVPSLTFVADANVVVMVGAKPVPVDSKSLDDWNISYENFVKKVTPKTKAAIVVHYAGYPCSDVEQIAAYCRQKDIFLIEDVAHAPGASINGKMCGSFGAVGCFSFFSNKNLSVGEGGMLSVSKNSELAAKLRALRSHGMTTSTMDRHKGRANTYDVFVPSLNYRIDEIRSAIGRVQLTKLSLGNEKRKQHSLKYKKLLGTTELKLPFFDISSSSMTSAYHIFPVLLPSFIDRPKLMAELRERGIQTSIHYPGFWDFTAYKNEINRDEYPITKTIVSAELTLPLFPTMTEGQIEFVAENLKAVAFSGS